MTIADGFRFVLGGVAALAAAAVALCILASVAAWLMRRRTKKRSGWRVARVRR